MTTPTATYDFSRLGRRMPYTVPDGFFAGLTDAAIKGATTHPRVSTPALRGRLRPLIAFALAAAAAVALFVAVNTAPAQPDVQYADVQQAYDNLSNNDQAYLAEIYQDDTFLNQ